MPSPDSTDRKPGAAVDLVVATALRGGAGRYRADLADCYRLAVGPFGGYLVALMLRAALEGADGLRPASIQCQFLHAADPGAIDVVVTGEGAASRMPVRRIHLHQAGRPVACAFVRLSDPRRRGVDRHEADVPHVPPPSLVPGIEMLFSDVRPVPGLEVRPLFEPPLGVALPPSPPPWPVTAVYRRARSGPTRLRAWARIVPRPPPDDAALDAGRAAMVFDWMAPALATLHHAGRRFVVHSTADLSMCFHQASPGSDWLLCEVDAGSAAGGLVPAVARLWDEDGHLVASAVQQLVQRVLL